MYLFCAWLGFIQKAKVASEPASWKPLIFTESVEPLKSSALPVNNWPTFELPDKSGVIWLAPETSLVLNPSHIFKPLVIIDLPTFRIDPITFVNDIIII